MGPSTGNKGWYVFTTILVVCGIVLTPILHVVGIVIILISFLLLSIRLICIEMIQHQNQRATLSQFGIDLTESGENHVVRKEEKEKWLNYTLEIFDSIFSKYGFSISEIKRYNREAVIIYKITTFAFEINIDWKKRRVSVCISRLLSGVIPKRNRYVVNDKYVRKPINVVIVDNGWASKDDVNIPDTLILQSDIKKQLEFFRGLIQDYFELILKSETLFER